MKNMKKLLALPLPYGEQSGICAKTACRRKPVKTITSKARAIPSLPQGNGSTIPCLDPYGLTMILLLARPLRGVAEMPMWP